MDHRVFYVSKFKDTVPLAGREESPAEGAGRVQLDGLFSHSYIQRRKIHL